MDTFPDTTYAPNQEGFSDVPSDEAVLVVDMSSGYPQPNKLFTFDPRNFSFDQYILEHEKQEIMIFYENNKDVSFYWKNKQDNVQYEVIFLGKPECALAGRSDLWKIALRFRQASS